MDSFRCILYVYKRTLLRANDDGKRMGNPSSEHPEEGNITLGRSTPQIDCDVWRHVVVRLVTSGILGEPIPGLGIVMLTGADFIDIPSASALHRGELTHGMAMRRHLVYRENMRLLATGFAGREVRIGLVDGHQGSSLTVALPCAAVDGCR